MGERILRLYGAAHGSCYSDRDDGCLGDGTEVNKVDCIAELIEQSVRN